jgi:hypothetical protein
MLRLVVKALLSSRLQNNTRYVVHALRPHNSPFEDGESALVMVLSCAQPQEVASDYDLLLQYCATFTNMTV